MLWIWIVLLVVAFCALVYAADQAGAKHLDNIERAARVRRQLDDEIARDAPIVQQAEIEERLHAARALDAARRRRDAAEHERIRKEAEAARQPYMQGRPGLAATPNGNRQQRRALKAASRRGR